MSDTGREVDLPGTEGRISELEDRVHALEDTVLPIMGRQATDDRLRIQALEDTMGKLTALCERLQTAYNTHLSKHNVVGDCAFPYIEDDDEQRLQEGRP